MTGQFNTLTALADPTSTKGVGNSDTLTVLADLETDSGPGLHLEPVTPGVWFTKRHKSYPVTGSDLQSAALMLHRDLLEAADGTANTHNLHEESRQFYNQHKTAPEDVRDNLHYRITYNKDTGGATAVLGVTQDMTLDTEGVKVLLRFLHQVTDELGTQCDRERPRNIALHLLEAAEQLEAYTDQDKARDLYGAYLSVFSNREYESDYTPAEHLDHTVTPEESLAGLEDAGLIFHSADERDENSTYFLTLFAGE